MKKIMTVVIFLLPVLSLNGCASRCDIYSTDPVCQTMIVGGLAGAAIVTAPILIAITINENHQGKLIAQEDVKIYQKYITGVADNDYEQLKQCVLHCNDDRYFYNKTIYETTYDPQLLEAASEKLIAYPSTCMTNEEYPIYLTAYLNLIEKQHKANQKVDDALVNQAWQLYQNMAKIAYIPENNTQCTSPADTDISNSIQSHIKYPEAFSKSIYYLMADIFNRSLKNLSQEEVAQRFTQCPELAPSNQNITPYDNGMVRICEAAYKQYTATVQLLDQPLESYKKIWRDWQAVAEYNRKQQNINEYNRRQQEITENKQKKAGIPK